MKRNIKIIIASSLVLILLLGGYFFIQKWDPDIKKEQDDVPVVPDTNIEYAMDINSGDIASVKISTGETSYKVKNGETVTIEGYSSNIMDSYKLSSVFYNVSSVTISRRMKDYTGNLSDYGLENTKKSVAVLMNDGTEYNLLIGNNTNFDGEYYAMLEGVDSVFTLSSYDVENLIKDPSEMRSMNICTLSADSTMSFTIKKKGQKELSVKYDENFVPTNEYVLASYLITYPYDNVIASLDKLKPLFESITPLIADSIVEENPKNLSLYGLDKPYELEITDNKGTKTTVKMGNYGENGNVYLMCNDTPVVYLAQCPFYEIVKDVKAEEYVEKFIQLFNIKTVGKIVITADGEEHTLLNVKDGGGYKVDGDTVTEADFKELYQLIIGVTAADFTNDAATGTEKCTFTFHFNDGKQEVFTYCIYNDRYSIVKADNGMTCLVLTKSLDNILTKLK